MRPLVSYDDITQSQPPFAGPSDAPMTHHSAKKRKTTQNGARNQPHQSVQHWDDPGSHAPQMSYDDAPATASTSVKTKADAEDAEEMREYFEEEEESRELTHEEIWDDSALIEAWNSAAAEYEVSIRISFAV